MVDLKKAAVLSECNRYRFQLDRVWDEALPVLPICMLNPSDGNADRDDPTIRRLTGFAKREGYGGVIIVNLYALRTPKPSIMWADPDRVTPENEGWLDAVVVVAENNGGKLLVAWGDDGDFESLASRFVDRIRQISHVELVCLGTTAAGNPRHPAAWGRGRVLDDQPIVPWHIA